MTDKLNVIDTIAKQDKFSTFAKLMTSSGATAVLKGPGDFTVFAPTNDAFGKIPELKMNELLNEANQTQLKALLSYHIVPGKWMAANLGSTPTRKAFTGEDLTFSDLNGLKVNGAAIQARNMEATNGVLHALDTVLAPAKTVAAVAATASAQPLVIPTALAAAAPSTTSTPTGSSVLSAVPTSAPATTTPGSDTKSIL